MPAFLAWFLLDLLWRVWIAMTLDAAAVRLSADVDPARARAVVAAAWRHATPAVPAALIVVLAWGESRFDGRARPACGPMQVYPRDLGLTGEAARDACRAWARDADAGVRAGVREIEIMLADARVHGDLRQALAYRACGNAAFVEGACHKLAWDARDPADGR
jgi:hypothetical protein